MIELDTIKIPTMSHTTLSPTISSSTVAARKHQNDVSSDHHHRLDKQFCVGDDLFYSHQMDNKLTWGDDAPMYHHINTLFQMGCETFTGDLTHLVLDIELVGTSECAGNNQLQVIDNHMDAGTLNVSYITPYMSNDQYVFVTTTCLASDTFVILDLMGNDLNYFIWKQQHLTISLL